MSLLGKLTRNMMIDQGVERADELLKKLRPSKYTESQWRGMAHNLTTSNQQIAAKMKQAPTEESRNWEWGTLATPGEYNSIVTSQSPDRVTVPFTSEQAVKNGIITHSHPGDLVDDYGNSYPSPVSHTDFMSGLGRLNGIMALDSNGGVGLAVNNPKVRFSQGDAEDIYWRAQKEAAKHFNPSPLAAGDDANLLRVLNRDGNLTGAVGKANVSAAIGMGRGLQRANILETFDYLPGEGQAAQLAKLEPAIEASAQKAEEIVRSFLKARGLTDKDIAAIMATVGTGGLITMADEINQQGDA